MCIHEVLFLIIKLFPNIIFSFKYTYIYFTIHYKQSFKVIRMVFNCK